MKRKRFGLKKTFIIFLICSMLLTSCGALDSKETQLPAGGTTAAETTASEIESTTAEDIVATEMVETTEQSETAEQKELSYQVVKRGTVEFKDWEKGFALFTSREDVDKLNALNAGSLEKYDDEWFKNHSFVLVLAGHGSCCFMEFNRIELDGKTLAVYIDCIDDDDKELYLEKGKDYVDPNYNGIAHTEDALITTFFIEFDRNGEEMRGLIDKVIYKSRQYRDASWSEVEIPLREPIPPVLETESIPFQTKYIKAQKDSYRQYDGDKGRYTEWENKAMISPSVNSADQCFSRNDLIGDPMDFMKKMRSELPQKPIIYALIGMNPSYQCEMQKVSIDGTTLRLYADAVYEGWEKLTDAEQAAIKAREQDCEVGLDTHKYEMFIGIDTEYEMEYLELMKTIETCVLTVTNVHTGETAELELKYFTAILDGAY